MVPRKADEPADAQPPFFVRSGQGRGPAGSAPGRPRSGGRRSVRLTGRGGITAIAAVSVIGAVLADATGVPGVEGGAFTAACVLAALLVRPADLLPLSVSPPLAYLAAALAVESLHALGDDGFARGLTIGVGGRLADVAPSLFLGTALVLFVGCFRGLPRNIRELSDELNGRTTRKRRKGKD